MTEKIFNEWEERVFLNRYAVNMRRIEILQERIARAESETLGRSGSMGDLPRSGRINHPTEEAALKLAEIRAKCEEDIRGLIAECDAIEEVVNRIDDPMLRELIRIHYLESRKWEDVAARLHYSTAYVKRELNQRALEEVHISRLRKEEDDVRG